MPEGARTGGPPAMEGPEIAELLGRQPTGALHLERNGVPCGTVPARVVSAEGDTIEVTVPRSSVHPTTAGADACLVVDEFESYEGIRGAIVQGKVHQVTGRTDHDVVRLVARRTSGFSFGGVAG